MLQVMLAEDHNIVRNGVRMLLETDNSINIVGEAVNGLEVLEHIAAGKEIDVVLADINMPGLDGISLLKELKTTSPGTKVVMLSMHDNEKYIAQAFLEGASGYLLKNVNADELIFSLKHVCTGGRYLCSELSMTMLDKLLDNGYHVAPQPSSDIEFSMREIEVLQLIAEGLTNNEMSEKLFISKRTVEGHRQSLIDKTGARNTASLIRFAVANGIIS
jgi:DNA-binding NarL/FixJ family response regulator